MLIIILITWLIKILLIHLKAWYFAFLQWADLQTVKYCQIKHFSCIHIIFEGVIIQNLFQPNIEMQDHKVKHLFQKNAYWKFDFNRLIVEIFSSRCTFQVPLVNLNLQNAMWNNLFGVYLTEQDSKLNFKCNLLHRISKILLLN